MRLRLALCLLAAIFVFACADSNPKLTIPEERIISVGDNFYNPQSLTITAGDTITWSWVGVGEHTVTSGAPGDPDAGVLFDSPPQRTGQFQYTFNQPGTFPYFDRIIGAAMTGTITVQPASGM